MAGGYSSNAVRGAVPVCVERMRACGRCAQRTGASERPTGGGGDTVATPPASQTPPALSLRGPLALETAWTRNFFDLAYEWRRIFAELLGTFLLVLVAAGGTVVNVKSRGGVPLDARVVAPALMVMAVIYFMGTVSGAHLNPAVTFAFALRGNFPWRRVPLYVAAQIAGAIGAAAFLRGTFGDLGLLGATVPGQEISAGTTVLIEAVLTMGLVSVILGTASGAQNIGSNAALAVAGYIALAGLWAAPITGASMNPARSLGPVIVGGHWSDAWTYVVGPLGGAVIAVGFAWVLRGAPSPAATVAAVGVLGPVPSSPSREALPTAHTGIENHHDGAVE